MDKLKKLNQVHTLQGFSPFDSLSHDKGHHMRDLFTGRASQTIESYGVPRVWVCRRV